MPQCTLDRGQHYHALCQLSSRIKPVTWDRVHCPHERNQRAPASNCAGVDRLLLHYQRLCDDRSFPGGDRATLSQPGRGWHSWQPAGGCGFGLVGTFAVGLDVRTAGSQLPGGDRRADRMVPLPFGFRPGQRGLGAALSPLLIGYLLGRGVPWRWALSGTGLLWLVYALVAYRVDRQDGPGREDEPTKKLDWGMLRERVFLGLFLVAFIYNGVAYSLLGWIALFMQRSAGFSVFLSASTISVFYAALTAGRFGCATFSERMGYGTTLMVLAAGLALTYPLVVFGNQPLVVVVGVFFTGLSLSGLFPTALAYGSRRWPQQTGAMTGVLNVAMTLGAMAPPLWTGTIADAWNFQGALGVNYGLVMLLLVVVLYLGRVEERV